MTRWLCGCIFGVCLLFCSGCSLFRAYDDVNRWGLGVQGIQQHDVRLSTGKMRYYQSKKAAKKSNKPPILFVHGFGTNATMTWSNQLPVFANERTVIAPDLYWSGGSLPSAKGTMHSPAAQADALAELLNVLEVKKVHVVGTSFGGYVSMQLALRHPKKVTRLSLINSAGLEPSDAERKGIEKRFPYAKGEFSRLIIPETPEDLRVFLRQTTYKKYPLPSFVLKDVMEQEFWLHKEERKKMAKHLEKHFLSARRLKKLRVPTQVIWGRHDHLLPLSYGKRLSRLIANASFHIVERAGHVPIVEQHTKTNQLLKAFLDK
ncbi:MAG TPA: hypothetical protein DCE42_21650 [Myxococcales bacterium]|nr:hypothetical protein [Deltaproteobacteria bacterium]HAA57385.1 hypothetical protein [Myxococcales bacterium]